MAMKSSGFFTIYNTNDVKKGDTSLISWKMPNKKLIMKKMKNTIEEIGA